jgi:hypothetical protein
MVADQRDRRQRMPGAGTPSPGVRAEKTREDDRLLALGGSAVV